ncbi:MAG: hypothetical protein AMXMBFR64_47010 [Myxococcales bacterium]
MTEVSDVAMLTGFAIVLVLACCGLCIATLVAVQRVDSRVAQEFGRLRHVIGRWVAAQEEAGRRERTTLSGTPACPEPRRVAERASAQRVESVTRLPPESPPTPPQPAPRRMPRIDEFGELIDV